MCQGRYLSPEPPELVVCLFTLRCVLVPQSGFGFKELRRKLTISKFQKSSASHARHSLEESYSAACQFDELNRLQLWRDGP